MTNDNGKIMTWGKTHPQGIQSYGLGFGLRGRLTLWILVIALLPMLIIGLVCDQLLENGLRQSIEKYMEAAIKSTTGNLEQYFQDMQRHAIDLSKQNASLELIQALTADKASSQTSAQGYLESKQGRELRRKWKRIHDVLDVRGYRNSMMIDLQGNILESLTDNSIIGLNVFKEAYGGARLSSACRHALQVGDVMFSDFYRYEQKGHEVILGHMVAPLMVENHLVGILALEFDVSTINRMLDSYRNLEPGFEMLLVGPDGLLRSDSDTRKNRRAMIDKRDVSFFDFPERGYTGKSDLHGEWYPGPDGLAMFGMNTSFYAGDIRYVLIGEVEDRTAFALLYRIRPIYWFFSLGLFIFVLTVAYIISGRVVRPVLNMADWAANVATGDLVLRDFESMDDEMGQFVKNFSQVVVFLQETASLARFIASGDFNVNIEPRSSKDDLGWALAQMTDSLREASKAMAALAGGDFDVNVIQKGPNDLFAKSINSMVKKIKATHEINKNQARMKSMQMELNETLSGDHNVKDLSRRILSFFCHALNASSGSFYVHDTNEDAFMLEGHYACRDLLPKVIYPGQGLPGKAALKQRRIMLDHCPDGFMGVHTLTETHEPLSVLACPFIHEDRVVAILELGLPSGIMENWLEFLDLVSENVAIAIMSSESRMKMKELLDKTVKQAEDLKAHQEKLDGINRDLQTKTIHLQETEAQLRKQEAELRAANRDLTEQAHKLKESEKRLKLKEEELTEANTALEERSFNLEEQKNAIKQKNLQLESTQKELVEKSRRLENSSRYKSEFLANMSHELRTPLNSILLISRLLSENKTGNLSEKHVELARTIFSSGNDLLTLIDDILDLSKIESGKLELQISPIMVFELVDKIRTGFSPMCQEKGIGFEAVVDPRISDVIHVDVQRIDQVIKNLVGNAIKFTTKGRVSVDIGLPDKLPRSLEHKYHHDDVLMISVRDTGVGIFKEKLSLIFDAFKQADGTISRKFGGTGLGLSISKQLVLLMGGDISVESEPGKGSVFKVFIPNVFKEGSPDESTVAGDLFLSEETRSDAGVFSTQIIKNNDRETLTDEPAVFSGKKLLIVDDDMRNVFALIHYLDDFAMEIIVAKSGRESLKTLEEHPDVDLVIMDIMMPEMDGFEAMEKIRAQERFKDIPVIALTAKAMKGDREKCLEAGASYYISKPVDMDLLISLLKKAME